MTDRLKNWDDGTRIAHVKKFFSSITGKYDFMNHLMSAGQDIRWRNFTAKRISTDAGQLLDIACGTGDLSFTLSRRFPKAEVSGLDFVPEMIEAAQRKNLRRGTEIEFTVGDALELPYPDSSFDACTIAFGFRNIPDKQRALDEMIRVLRPGGKILILEMTLPRSAAMRHFYRFYLKYVIPALGRLFTSDPDAYTYLSDSIQDFYQPEELSALFEEKGLTDIRAFPLSFGITYLHEGVTPR